MTSTAVTATITDEQKSSMIEVGKLLTRRGWDRFNVDVLSKKLGYPIAGFEKKKKRAIVGPTWTTVYECGIIGGKMSNQWSVKTADIEKVADAIPSN